MADQLYLERDAKNYGPYSTAHVLQLAAAGRLQPTDLIWKEGMAESVPAAQVKRFFPNALTGAPAANTNGPAVQMASPELAVRDVPNGLRLVSITEEADPEDIDGPTAQPTPPQAEVTDESSQDKPLVKPNPPRPKQAPVKKLRAIVRSGAVIMSQDGTTVRYRRKCQKCNFEDTNGFSMPIKMGTSNVSFFCPKCKKIRSVQIQGLA